MTDGVIQNVTISADPGAVLNISALSMLGTGILVDNTNAFTLTITAAVSIGRDEAWTNNSGNLFTVSGNVTLGGSALTVNGTGNTLISGVMGVTGSLIKDGSGTLTLTGDNIYTGGTAVNGGTLLVNNTAGSGAVTVNNAGSTLGGTGTISGTVTVNAGANIAPGNGGIPPQFLRQARSHSRPPPIFELISTAPPLAPDMTDSVWRQGELRLPEAILWSQSARHCRSGRHFSFWTKSPGAA